MTIIEVMLFLQSSCLILLVFIACFIIPKPKQILNVVYWPEHLKLREYNLKPWEVKDWTDLMIQRGFELYTLVPPTNGNKLVRVMYRKVRNGRGPYNRLDYVDHI